jgi:hypothetical protein
VAGLNDDGSDASEGDHGNNDSANARESINSQVNPPPPPHQSSSSSSRTGTGTLTSTSKAAAAVQKETATTTMPSNSFESASGANGNRESTSDATVSTAEDDGVPRLIISPEILAATSGVSGHYSITIYSVLVALIAVLFLQ